jgi:hypothetical protein
VIGRRRLVEALASLLTAQPGAASDATSYIALDVPELLKMTGWRESLPNRAFADSQNCFNPTNSRYMEETVRIDSCHGSE